MGNLPRVVVLLSWFAVVVSTVTWKENDHHVIVQNGYTLVSFNKLTNAIDQISADFSGAGGFKNNNLAEPFALKIKLDSSEAKQLCVDSKVKNKNTPAKAEWLTKSSEMASFRISNIKDHSVCTGGAKSTEDSVVSEEWTISLAENMRSATVNIRGEILQDISVDYILHGIYSNSPSLYGLFPKGVTQMMGNTLACMGSTQPLSRAYVLGDGAAMDIVRHKYAATDIFDDHESVADSNEADTEGKTTTSRRSTVVFKSAHETFGSGIEDVLFGNYPSTSGEMASAWAKSCWANTTAVPVTKGTTWEFGLTFIPNNYDFPPYLLNNVAATPYSVPFPQLRAYLTGIYASPVGCLQSYYDKQFGTIAPTISHPEVGYSPDTNFFDPDNFISLSAMMYSGDAYLLRQVKYVLHRTAETMCGIGREQVEWYCNPPIPISATATSQTQSQLGRQEDKKRRTSRAAPPGRKHKIFSTNRFNYTASAGTFSLLVILFPLHSSIRTLPSSLILLRVIYSTHDMLITAFTFYTSALIPYLNFHCLLQCLHQCAGGETANNTRTGQLMHHFVSLVPTYESIAGSEQLGPNIFWTFTVLRYIALTQDASFASAIFPFVDLSTKYVLTFFDAEKGLFRAPGPLWIDVIVRENYTSDSNGMLVPYLQKVADFYDYMQVTYSTFGWSMNTLLYFACI